jgi:predicted HTH transcriptional regulator
MRNLLHRAGYIEKMGTGITKMRRLIAEAGLPPIEFEFGTFFTAIFRRPARIEPIVFDERGGVFVCQKWLKDRKGRELSEEEIEHYQKVVVALNETIRDR